MTTFYKDINHLLGNKEFETPTIEKNVECFTRAINGDDEAIDEFILQNMKLVGGVVTKFVKRHHSAQYLADDMFSEGLVILTQVVQQWVHRIRENRDAYQDLGTLDTGKKINVIGYLYVAIYRKVQECYELDSSETISKKIRDKHTPPGKTTPTKKVDFPQEWLESQTYDAFEEIFYLEKIYGVCKTDEEKHIIDARLMGLSQKDIAKRVGRSVPTIRLRERTLYARFRKQQGISE